MALASLLHGWSRRSSRSSGPVAHRALCHAAAAVVETLEPRQMLSAYTWDRLPIGGGGYLYGIVDDPNQAGVFYARGDNTNLWRRSTSDTEWTPLMDSLKNYSDSRSGPTGAMGIAVAPGDSNTLYAAFGNGYNYWNGESPHHGIYKSTNRGASWTQVYNTQVSIIGNLAGEPLMIDPNNAGVLYYGSARYYPNGSTTPKGGLFRSAAGGGSGTWSQVSGVPSGFDWIDPTRGNDVIESDSVGNGVSSVFIDTRHGAVSGSAIGATGNVSKVVYLVIPSNDPDARLPYSWQVNYRQSAFNGGVFRSADGGATFSLLPGSPAVPRRIAMGPDNSIYVTAKDGIYKFDGTLTSPGTANWSRLSGTANLDFDGIDTDPADRRRLVATGHPYAPGNNSAGGFWITTDSTLGTITWQKKNWYNQGNTPFTLTTPGHYLDSRFAHAGPASVKFDRSSTANGVTPRLYEVDAFGVWKTENIYAGVDNIRWDSMNQGYEGTIIRQMVSPAAGSDRILYAGGSDIGQFRFSNTTDYATSIPVAYGSGFTVHNGGFAVGEAQGTNSPRNAVVSNQNGIFTSTDDGVSYTRANHPPAKSDAQPLGAPYGYVNAQIAMSATNRDKVVIVGGGTVPWYTSNAFSGGTSITWNPTSSIFDYAPVPDANEYTFPKVLASDKVVGDQFYIYAKGSDNKGKLYISTDGGANWTVKNSGVLPAPNSNSGGMYVLVTTPGTGGVGRDLWIASNNELWHSTDAGGTFTKTTSVKQARAFTFGANALGDSDPTVYVAGKVTIGGSDVEGIFRSTDMGVTWERINDDAHQYPGLLIMEGDRKTFGRLFLSNQSGVVYGEPSAATDTTAPTSVNNTGTSVTQGISGTTITNSMLRYTDTVSAASAVTYTLTTLPSKGTLKKSGTALALNGTFTQDDLDNSRITYDNTSNSGNDSFAFTVRDAANNAASSASFAITVNKLAAPGSFTLTAGDGKITVSWATVTNATGYKIKYGTTSGSYTTTVDVPGGSSTSKEILGLPNGTTYYVIMDAYNAAGEGNATVESSKAPAAAATTSAVFTSSDTRYGVQLSGSTLGITTVGTSGNASPSNEQVANAINGTYAKYLNFGKTNTGLMVSPSFGSTNGSVVTQLRVWTANDVEARDPASYKIYGTNTALSSGGMNLSSFTLIAEGNLSLPSGRNTSSLSDTNSQLVSFTNTTAYKNYLILFPTVKNATSANSMQIGEVQLYGTAAQTSALLDRTGWSSKGNGGSSNTTAFDGSTSTGWWSYTAQTSGYTFIVDMGASKTLTRLVMDSTGHTSDYARGFNVYMSTDGVNWGSSLGSFTGTSSTVDVSFAATTGRYVKIELTTASSYWWWISEFNAYGY